MLAKLLKGKVLVVSHKNADIDCVSSFAALEELVKTLKINCTLTLGLPNSPNRGGAHIASVLKVKPQTIAYLNLSDYSQLILIDTQLNNAPDEILAHFSPEDTIIIDHHEIHEASKKLKHKILKKEASTTTLIYELFQKNKLTKRAAKAIIYGLVADTGHLRFATTSNLSILTSILMSNKLNYQDILSDLKTEDDISERIAVLKASQRISIEKCKGKIIAISRIKSFESAAASKILSLGADIALVSSLKDSELRIIGRSRSNLNINLADIFIKASEELGGKAGGHPQASVLNTALENKDKALPHILKKVKQELN